MTAQKDDAGQTGAAAHAAVPSLWQRFMRFLREVQIELKKTSWPTRNELTKSVAVVIMTVLVVAFVLAFYDITAAAVMKWLLKLQ